MKKLMKFCCLMVFFLLLMNCNNSENQTDGSLASKQAEEIDPKRVSASDPGVIKTDEKQSNTDDQNEEDISIPEAMEAIEKETVDQMGAILTLTEEQLQQIKSLREEMQMKAIKAGFRDFKTIKKSFRKKIKKNILTAEQVKQFKENKSKLKSEK